MNEKELKLIKVKFMERQKCVVGVWVGGRLDVDSKKVLKT